MTNCNATLTVCTTTDDVVAYGWMEPNAGRVWSEEFVPDGVAVVRDGDRLVRLDVTALTCDEGEPHRGKHWNDDDNVHWDDDAPGATSHADNTPRTTDGEWRYAYVPEDTPPADVHTVITKNGITRCSCGYGGGSPSDVEYHAFTQNQQPPADVCPDCDGKGTECGCPREDPPDDEFCPPCPSCGGTGRHGFARHPFGDGEPEPVECESCGGTGEESQHRYYCSKCNGTGDRPAESEVVAYQSASDGMWQDTIPEGVPIIRRGGALWTLVRPRPADADAEAINVWAYLIDHWHTAPPLSIVRAALEAAAAHSEGHSAVKATGKGDRPAVTGPRCQACWEGFGAEHLPDCERHPRNVKRDRPAATDAEVRLEELIDSLDLEAYDHNRLVHAIGAAMLEAAYAVRKEQHGTHRTH